MKNATSFALDFRAGISRPRGGVAITGRVPDRAFIGLLVLAFLMSAAVTALWCGSMSAMRGMAMPGGWTMSMAWMRMPGQTWGDATTLFVGMWVVMMVAMMLPSLGPVLWRWRLAMVKSGVGSPDSMAAAIGTGYFVVWTGVGMLLFPLGACVAAIAMRSTALARDVPFASGLVVLMAGALQFTGWKAHHLACCRNAPGNAFGVPEDARTAWRQGLRLGMHCGLTCANLTAVLVALGVMNLGAMAIVTAAITVERVVPRAERVAQAIGIAIVTGGLILIARATGLV